MGNAPTLPWMLLSLVSQLWDSLKLAELSFMHCKWLWTLQTSTILSAFIFLKSLLFHWRLSSFYSYFPIGCWASLVSECGVHSILFSGSWRTWWWQQMLGLLSKRLRSIMRIMRLMVSHAQKPILESKGRSLKQRRVSSSPHVYTVMRPYLSLLLSLVYLLKIYASGACWLRV